MIKQFITYQANQHGLLGHGPHSKASAGCVLCSCYMGLIQLGLIDPAVTSLDMFHQRCFEEGAFDDAGTEGDMLDVAKAVDPWGARCDAEHITSGLQENLAACFIDAGVALLRIAFTEGDAAGKHTILGSDYADEAGSVACLDPAIGHVTLKADLTQQGLGWGHDAEGKHILKDYHVVNIRRIYKR